jgi:hypothetical protein
MVTYILGMICLRIVFKKSIGYTKERGHIKDGQFKILCSFFISNATMELSRI